MDEQQNSVQTETEYEGLSFSELLVKDEAAFAKHITGIVDQHQQNTQDYRDKAAANIQYWRNQHWKSKASTNMNEPNPNVPAVHSMIENCIADTMDNFPDQVMRGVNGDDDIYAAVLTDGVRFTMQRANYEEVFERTVASATKIGTGVMHRFWNKELADGLGDIDYKFYPISDVVWDTDVKRIDDGRFFATFDYLTAEEIKSLYPGIDITQSNADTEEEVRDNIEDEATGGQIRSRERNGLRVINFYWKSREPRTVNGESTGAHITYVNSARVIGNVVLDKHPMQYAYNSYMFSMIPYIALEDEPVGLSLIDIFQDEADQINLIQKEFCKNLQASSDIRWAVNNTANVNEQELTDKSKKLIHADAIHEGAMREFKVMPFNSQPLEYLQAMLGRMKEYSGQLDVNIGQSSAGVTAASAIMALQEYGAKRARAFIRVCQREHKRVVRDTIFLMDQHYTTQRLIRISREARELIERQKEEVEKAKAGGKTLPVSIGNDNKAYVDFKAFELKNFDEDYDIEIIPQKKTAATSNLINSVVQQLASGGTFQGIEDLLLDCMEVPGIGKVAKKIRDRRDMQAQFEQVVQQTQQLAEQNQQIIKQNQQLQQQTQELTKQVWAEKLNTLKAQISAALRGGEGETDGPETAEEAIAQFAQQMGLSQSA